MSQTEKPVILKIYDFKQNIIQTINNSHLPASIVQEVLAPIIAEVMQNAKIEYENALKEYNSTPPTTSEP